MDENDILVKDREPQKTIPYPAAHTYIARIGKYHHPPGQKPIQTNTRNMAHSISVRMNGDEFPRRLCDPLPPVTDVL